jgi:hypothetical protein
LCYIFPSVLVQQQTGLAIQKAELTWPAVAPPHPAKQYLAALSDLVLKSFCALPESND